MSKPPTKILTITFINIYTQLNTKCVEQNRKGKHGLILSGKIMSISHQLNTGLSWGNVVGGPTTILLLLLFLPERSTPEDMLINSYPDPLPGSAST